jgi:CRISPR-associated protein Cas1
LAIHLASSSRQDEPGAFKPKQQLDQLITHPIFGYRISYRRVLEVQSRLLARTLLGELELYPGFEFR